MKKLFLIRHAKSSWDDISLNDFDRPLNERGKKNAPMMGEVLASKKILPDLIISSPAKRASKTAQIIAEKLGYKSKHIIYAREIYEANVKILLALVTSIDKKYDCVMLFGHNPALTDFLNYLTDTNIINIPTCGIAQINFHTHDWREISKDTGELVYFDVPKNYS